MPDPRDAARNYRSLVERGDAQGIYELLSEEARREYGPKDVKALVDSSQKELAANARAISEKKSQVSLSAVVQYEDGEQARLKYEQGTFRVDAAGTLPAAARTPTNALAELRRALARRSYPALMRILTPETRSAAEADLRGLVEGLEHPEALDVKVEGDRAQVQLKTGHRILLRRDGDLWRVEDFDKP